MESLESNLKQPGQLEGLEVLQSPEYKAVADAYETIRKFAEDHPTNHDREEFYQLLSAAAERIGENGSSTNDFHAVQHFIHEMIGLASERNAAQGI